MGRFLGNPLSPQDKRLNAASPRPIGPGRLRLSGSVTNLSPMRSDPTSPTPRGIPWTANSSTATTTTPRKAGRLPVPETTPSEHTVAGFAVTDVDAIVKQLNSRGVAFERFAGFPHQQNGVLVTPDGARVAWFRDPDGNLLSIVQYDAA